MPSTLTITMTKITFLLVALLFASTDACSCLGPISIESSIESSPIAVRTFVLDVAATEQFDDFNGINFIPSYVFQVYKGCNVKDLLWIRSPSNEALCGVGLNPFYSYLLFGTVSEEQVPGYGIQQVLRIALCDAHTSAAELTIAQRQYLQQLPSPECEANNGGVVCESNADCNGSDYCAGGECLPSGECQTDDDCYNPANEGNGSFIQCLATQTCDVNAGTCSLQCCEQPVNCFADPCQVTECNEDYETCVADYCSGSCDARFFNARGDRVCQ